jgi:hypothetical protein
MKRRTPVYIVCSPRPRVGRTLVARLLIDFFLMDERPVAAFDLNASEPSLLDYMPDHTAAAEIADIQGQMALFDRLIVDDKTAKIVDLRPAAFEQFFAVMQQIDFVEEARRRSVEPVTLFIVDADRVSARAYAGLQHRLPEMILVPVYNEAVAKGEGSRDKFPLSRAASVPLQIPLLIPLLHRYIATPPFSFADFRGAPPENIPTDIYTELHHWMRRVFLEFRELELRLLFDDVQSSLLKSSTKT